MPAKPPSKAVLAAISRRISMRLIAKFNATKIKIGDPAGDLGSALNSADLALADFDTATAALVVAIESGDSGAITMAEGAVASASTILAATKGPIVTGYGELGM